MKRLSKDAIDKISGPAWQPLKKAFLDLSDELLAVDDTATGELTTIYVKFSVPTKVERRVFAVAWLKNSKSITVGFALPDGYDANELTAPPAGMRYAGITRYLIIRPGDALPPQLPIWAKAAYANVIS